MVLYQGLDIEKQIVICQLCGIRLAVGTSLIDYVHAQAMVLDESWFRFGEGKFKFHYLFSFE